MKSAPVVETAPQPALTPVKQEGSVNIPMIVNRVKKLRLKRKKAKWATIAMRYIEAKHFRAILKELDADDKGIVVKAEGGDKDDIGGASGEMVPQPPPHPPPGRLRNPRDRGLSPLSRRRVAPKKRPCV